MPLISVIVPVYKVEPYLRRCVDSILNQTFRDFELILIDDGSPDDCPAICDEYAAKDSRVVVIHQKNGGLSAARNAGIDWAFANSDSQWLTFIDSDDWVHPQYLEILLSGVKDYGAEISIGQYQLVERPIPIQHISAPQVSILPPVETYLTWFVPSIAAWNKMYAKYLFRDLRYPVGKLCEDAFTTYQLLFQSEHIAVIDSILYYYYRNDAGIMGSPWRPAKMDEIEAWKAHINFFKVRKETQCLELATHRYISVLHAHKLNIAKTDWKKSWYYWKVCNNLRYQLIRHHRIYPFQQNIAVYEHAFPVAMWCYWTYQGIIGKIKRVIKNVSN